MHGIHLNASCGSIVTAVLRGQSPQVLRFYPVDIPKRGVGSYCLGTSIAMRQRRRLLRSDRIARNLLWLLVLLIVACVVLVVRGCHP
jgi:hypothetical protein